MKCGQCGKDNADSLNYCFHCGSPLSGNAIDNLSPDEQELRRISGKQPGKGSLNKKLLLIIAAAVAALGIIGALVLIFLPKAPPANINSLAPVDAVSQNAPAERASSEADAPPEKGITLESGKTGSCSWLLDDNGVLFVEGSGTMEDYAAYKSPWDAQRLQIKQIYIGEGVTGVGVYSFIGCENVLKVRLPETIQKINDAAFCQCNAMKQIRIPKSAEFIGFNAFGACRNLKEIEVDENNAYYTSVDGNLYTKDKSTLLLYAIGKTDDAFSVPAGTKKIGDDAFEKSPYLKRIIIPDSTTAIGRWAFEHTESLLYVEIPASVTEIADNAFEQTLDKLTVIGQSRSYAETFAKKNGIHFSTK